MFFSCQFQKKQCSFALPFREKAIGRERRIVPHSVTENQDPIFLLVIFVYVNNYFYICSIDCESEAVAMY